MKNNNTLERFESVERSGDLLEFRVAGRSHLAKASLSRLLQQFQNKVDFVILTPYRDKVSEQENSAAFSKFPAEFRSLAGTKKIGAFELVGHWQKQGSEEQLERSWFFTNGDPNLSGEEFIAAAQALAAKYQQDALIISRQGVTTLEEPNGAVLNTLTTAGAIEDATLKLNQARNELQKGEREGYGYSELKRMKDRGRDTKIVFDKASDAGTTKEGSNAYSVEPCIFVRVPGSNSSRWAFSIWGIDYPNWPIVEPVAALKKADVDQAAEALLGPPVGTE